MIVYDAMDSLASTGWTGTDLGAAPRDGRTGIGAVNPSGVYTMTRTIAGADESNRLTIGFAFFTANTGRFLELRSDTAATIHVSLSRAADGTITVFRSTSTTLATSAVGVVPASTWVYIELDCLLHDTTGLVSLRVNNTVVASATNVDTKNAGTKTTFDAVRLLTSSSFDDLYLATGADAGVFHGDTQVNATYNVIQAHNRLEALTGFTTTDATIGPARNTNGIVLGTSGVANLTFTPSDYRLIVGFAYKSTALPASGSRMIVAVRNPAGTVMTGLYLRPDGGFNIGTGITGIAAGTFVAGNWYYVEWRVTSSAAAGTSLVRINGVDIDNRTNINTGLSPYSLLNQVEFGAVATVDDMYLVNGSEVAYLGDPGPGILAEFSVWNGTTFTPYPVRYWNGSAFVDAVDVRTWNGSAFV